MGLEEEVKLTLTGGPFDGEVMDWHKTPPPVIDRCVFHKRTRGSNMETMASSSSSPTLARYTLDLKAKAPIYKFERFL